MCMQARINIRVRKMNNDAIKKGKKCEENTLREFTEEEMEKAYIRKEIYRKF